jgi:uncharacterized membrane protein
MVALASAELNEMDPFDVEGDWLSVALPRPADECFDLFSDIERTPEWLTIVRCAVVTERDPVDRPKKVAFLCSLHRATVGYTLAYRYRSSDRRIAWSTPRRSSLKVRGFVQFQEMSSQACLMTYCLDLAFGRGLPRFDDDAFAAHATSASMHDFRDFVMRTLP